MFKAGRVLQFSVKRGCRGQQHVKNISQHADKLCKWEESLVSLENGKGGERGKLLSHARIGGG